MTIRTQCRLCTYAPCKLLLCFNMQQVWARVYTEMNVHVVHNHARTPIAEAQAACTIQKHLNRQKATGST